MLSTDELPSDGDWLLISGHLLEKDAYKCLHYDNLQNQFYTLQVPHRGDIGHLFSGFWDYGIASDLALQLHLQTFCKWCLTSGLATDIL